MLTEVESEGGLGPMLGQCHLRLSRREAGILNYEMAIWENYFHRLRCLSMTSSKSEKQTFDGNTDKVGWNAALTDRAARIFRPFGRAVSY